MRVPFEHGHGLVPRDGHDSTDVPPGFQYPGHEGVPEVVKAHIMDPGPLTEWTARGRCGPMTIRVCPDK